MFERWILNAPNSHVMIEDTQRNFELGGHKDESTLPDLDADTNKP
jgi:hypothetical protein